MKKNLVLVCMLSFVFISGACSSGSGSKKGSGFFQNTVGGKQIEFYSKSNYSNISENKRVIYTVSGETFLLGSILWIQDPDDKYSFTSDYSAPELANALWTITGNIGYFVSEGNTTASGADASITITGTAGATGTISIELGGLKCTYPIKVVASQADLPPSD